MKTNLGKKDTVIENINIKSVVYESVVKWRKLKSTRSECV